MSTLIKVEFNEQSKCVTATTKVESDTMEPDEVLKLAEKLAVEAQEKARSMTMVKQKLGF